MAFKPGTARPARTALRLGARIGFAAAAFFAPALAIAQDSFVKRFLFEKTVPVITVTDVTDEGRILRLPSREHPMYYEALVLGNQTWGRPIANLDTPDKKAMVKLILKLLADQGYFPGTPGHDPEILLTFAWGTMDGMGRSLLFLGGDKLDLMWELDSSYTNPSARYLTRFKSGPLGAQVTDFANGPLYAMSIQAFDRAKAVDGKTVLLWHTKVGCPSTGLAMESTLRQMAREAAPFFGRETAKPIWTSTTEKHGKVDLGELKVLEAIDPSRLPITDVDDPLPAKH